VERDSLSLSNRKRFVQVGRALQKRLRKDLKVAPAERESKVPDEKLNAMLEVLTEVTDEVESGIPPIGDRTSKVGKAVLRYNWPHTPLAEALLALDQRYLRL
jgi:hypothetical protein